MAIKTTNRPGWTLDEADDLSSAVAFGDGKPTWGGRRYDGAPASRTVGEEHTRFRGSASWEAIKETARLGWAEGRSKLTRELDTAKFVHVSSNHRAEALDVGGSHPNVQEFIAGNPACMVTMGTDQSRTRPIFRFLVGIATSAGIAPEIITRRGAAILSWIDRLEADGARCEVVAFMTYENSPHKYTLALTAKRADEPLDVDRLAFVLMHPGMVRRVGFACMEQHPELKSFGVGYGSPRGYMPGEIVVPHSICFNEMHLSNSAWATPEGAIGEVERIITQAIRHSEPQQEAA